MNEKTCGGCHWGFRAIIIGDKPITCMRIVPTEVALSFSCPAWVARPGAEALTTSKEADLYREALKLLKDADACNYGAESWNGAVSKFVKRADPTWWHKQRHLPIPPWVAEPEERCQSCRHPIDPDGHCSVECANDRKGGWLPGKDAPKDGRLLLCAWGIVADVAAYVDGAWQYGEDYTKTDREPDWYIPIPPTPEVDRG